MTPMQELLEYIKNAHTFTFLPDQLAKTIEDKYLPMEKSKIREAFDDGEINVWNGKRDECFEFEGGIDYFKKHTKTPYNVILNLLWSTYYNARIRNMS